MSVALLATTPIVAIAPATSLGGLYMRARAAEAAGDTNAANAGFATLMAREPANVTIATRAYRQALAGGDMALALRAAHLLELRQALLPDARALLALEQIRARNWVKARELTRQLGQDRVFGFLAPYFQAWIAFDSGAADPLTLVEAGGKLPLAAAYHDEQRALLLIALGRLQDAAAAAGAQPTMRLPAAVSGANQGLALLLTHVASDFARQHYMPVGLIMARMAAYVAPDQPAAWLLTADLLRIMRRPDLAIAVLDHVDARDALATTARAMRIGLLHDIGRRDAALAEALVAARRPGAGAEDWSRLGDLYLALSRHGDAAAAYAEAIKAAESAHVPVDAVWPLLLQLGGALEQAGDWPGAKAALWRAYALAPAEAIVLNQFGYSRIEHREDIEPASAMIEQASKLRPDDPAIADSLGWVLYLRGKVADAVPLLERAAANDPDEPTINEHLGDVYWALGRHYEARYAWRAALITAADKDRARLTTKIDVGAAAAP